ncbi:unnamed protein product [Auanema sp. JU1783]|nr:unnamed protein product [Auanema sp. JU1783]
MTQDCVILDNGAYTIKVGSSKESQPKLIPNCITKSKQERKRVYVGDEISECLDKSSLFFVLPFEKGYLVNWDVEQQLWEKALNPYAKDASEYRFAMSDPNYLIPAIRDQSDEIVFDVFGFASVYKNSAAGFIANSPDNLNKRCVLVIDCGFSFTTIAPFVDGRPIRAGIMRVDIGGKALTNQLKEWISYRELNVLDETYVINECKEDSCFVSNNFCRDMEKSKHRDFRNTIRKEYVLPDYATHQRGYLRDPTAQKDNSQGLSVNHERFCLPEALFRPTDLGLDQMGIAEAAAESLSRVPENLRPALAQNVALIGGSMKFPGMRERFLTDFSGFVDSTWAPELSKVADPITEAWSCAVDAISTGFCDSNFLTKSQWDEYGDSFHKKFMKFQ